MELPNTNIQGRHIQDHDTAESVIPHWGYPERVMPCANDPGTCEYLDAVYWMHDVSMLYTFIMWAVIGGILFILVAVRIAKPRRTITQSLEPEAQVAYSKSLHVRAWGTVGAFCRRRLLPESLHSIFGHVTRLQLLVLAAILTYLLIFSLIGIVYKTWITPIEGSTLHNTRTGLGGFADRVGALAYALTPLTVALSTRENLLSLITGIPYQHFNFLHRWTGRIIFIQSFLHTLGWTIIEGRLYQPQPRVYTDWISQLYMVFGIIAQILITFLYLFSIKRVVRWTGHEFFRKSHYIAGILYLGACWGHWDKLACWMIASIGVLFLDRGCRLLRMLLIHFKLKDDRNGIGFKPAQGNIISFDDGSDGTVVRLEFVHRHPSWTAGQHFFLCFPELNIWQSHPFTPASVPTKESLDQRHLYIVRCLGGETARLATLASKTEQRSTPVILTGPFGGSVLDRTAPNVLVIAGGTGISFALPMAAAAVQNCGVTSRVELVWIIKHARNIDWVEAELDALLSSSPAVLSVRIFVTRESADTSLTKDWEANLVDKEHPASRMSTGMFHNRDTAHVEWLADHHPDIDEVLQHFVHRSRESGGRIQVLASGPAELGRDLRDAVAKANDASKVWKGIDSYDVGLYWDNRFY
ncbi:hypothetical protein VTO42DRAFT_2751 [Malbranchea cinnamomea]